ncbi:Mrp family chromosome partitioning ATPase [Novosphingobium sp. PhB165]|uniref:AAA family ATPase n=1 Tax=Novosphingobium sp. PhB165 TaxID=2485105 RepID=UPI00104542A1|nr:AAA family ATPase [Novosphingobium sp. PhB165]TCM22316.1 Mrp family chromosome partitioning ATPase [Novosphingobium sp. PhB165]
MTEQSKIPQPGATADDAVPAKRESLIERAAGRFDFSRMTRPVLPAVPEVSAAQVQTPPPVPVQPAVQTSPRPVEPATPSPVTFTGPRHPIDRERLREQGLIVPEGTVTALLEEFRIVKRQLLVQAADLRRQNAGAAAQRVLICSPHPGEGKTYCALNLALAIAAEKENEVLLVDADFAKPSILSTLGLPGGRGLMDALMDETIDVADCVLGTDVPGLWVLPAGDTTVNDSEYLSTSRTAEVLGRLTEGTQRRIVIFDSPPALAASPAAELAKHVGQAVVIVRADRTGQGALDDAVSLLDACPNVQLLLNGAQFSPSGRRFGSYYGYSG